VLVFALWWLYFLHPAGDGLVLRRNRSFAWGYGHYGIFVALAALGAGLEVAVEQTGHHIAASPVAVGYAIAIPVAVLLVLMWALHAPICSPSVLNRGAIFTCTAAILVVPLVVPGVVVVAIATACVLLVARTIAGSSAPAAELPVEDLEFLAAREEALDGLSPGRM